MVDQVIRVQHDNLSLVPLPPAVTAAHLLPPPVVTPLPPARVASASLPEHPAAIATETLPPAISTAPLPPAPVISAAPLPPAIAAAPLLPPPVVASLPPAVAPPLDIVAAPLQAPAVLKEAKEEIGNLVVLQNDKLCAVTQKGSKKDQLKINKNITLWHDLTKEQKGKLLCK